MTISSRTVWLCVCVSLAVSFCDKHVVLADSRPNILFCISDDQSYGHTGADGDPVVKTPSFDRVAREGVRFIHAFCDAPSCGPSRSAILTGQHIWRLEEAGNIHSTLPSKFATYTEMLEQAGYFVGYTGKGWSPGRLEPGGRSSNPAGRGFVQQRRERPMPGISNLDYAANFADFLAQRPRGKPFCFWLGTYEPHRGYKNGSGVASGKNPSDVVVPPQFPDNEIVRSDMLDYFVEIEHFDEMVGRALAQLDEQGEVENTIVVVTSDHGMPFPRAKASLYDAGTRVPLAIRWPAGIESPGRVSKSFVSLSDICPTLLEAAGLQSHPMMTARSLMDVFRSAEVTTQDPARQRAFFAMERHDGCRRGGKGYPCRGLRTADFLFIKNYEAQRWPAGDPDASVCARAIPYGEVDSSPTKQLLMDNADDPDIAPFHDLAFGKRPSEELYDLAADPGQLKNIAGEQEYADELARLRNELEQYLIATADPRATGGDAPWDYYPYYGLRRNKDWTVDPKP